MISDKELDEKATLAEKMVDDIFMVLGALRDATKEKVTNIHSKQQSDERAGEQDQKSEPTLS